ncbi:hypothetical protein FHS57_001728 [Runella defluvii]|uniref:Uncharacterized protein n=1 Tax=Runella defluvii TaxID=370973 RepID=A0A7W5ZL19_9BACT|nr:hypothetical protein [Runella defluvii]
MNPEKEPKLAIFGVFVYLVFATKLKYKCKIHPSTIILQTPLNCTFL